MMKGADRLPPELQEELGNSLDDVDRRKEERNAAEAATLAARRAQSLAQPVNKGGRPRKEFPPHIQCEVQQGLDAGLSTAEIARHLEDTFPVSRKTLDNRIPDGELRRKVANGTSGTSDTKDQSTP